MLPQVSTAVLLCVVPLLLTVQVWRAGRQYKQSFSRGVPQGPLEESAAEEVDAAARGTQVRLKVWRLWTEIMFRVQVKCLAV